MKRIFLIGTMVGCFALLQACASSGETKTADTSTAPATAAPKTYSDTDVKAAMDEFVKAYTGKDGTLELKVLHDGQAKDMKLKFVKVHDPVAVLNATSAFACTDFKDTKKDKKTRKMHTYDIDFWLTPGPDGKLTVIPEKIELHKVNGKKLFDYDRAGNKIPVG